MKQTIAAVQPEKEEEEIAAFQKRKNKNFNQTTRRRVFPTTPPMPRPVQDTKETPITTRAKPDLETMTTGMENTASTANCKTTPRTNVSRGFEKRNRAETDKAEPIGQECT